MTPGCWSFQAWTVLCDKGDQKAGSCDIPNERRTWSVEVCLHQSNLSNLGLAYQDTPLSKRPCHRGNITRLVSTLQVRPTEWQKHPSIQCVTSERFESVWFTLEERKMLPPSIHHAIKHLYYCKGARQSQHFLCNGIKESRRINTCQTQVACGDKTTGRVFTSEVSSVPPVLPKAQHSWPLLRLGTPSSNSIKAVKSEN